MLVGAIRSTIIGKFILKELDDIMKSGLLPDSCEATSISSKCITACLQIACQTGLTSQGGADLKRKLILSPSISSLANESPVEQPLPVEQ